LPREIGSCDTTQKSSQIAQISVRVLLIILLLALSSNKKTMDKRPWMEITEYASLAGCALGTLVAGITNQMIYSTAPLTLALCLNTLNRNRLRTDVNQIPPAVDEVVFLKQQIQEIQAKQLSLNNYGTELAQKIAQQLNEPTTIQRLRQIFQQSDKSQLSTSDLEKLIAVQVNKAVGEQSVTINHFLPIIDKSILELKKNLVVQVDKSVGAQVGKFVDEVAKINELLTNVKPYDYQLIIDRSGSRDVFLEAIEKTEHRLILVCPWFKRYGIDDKVLAAFKALLDKGGRVDIGWGYLSDLPRNYPFKYSQEISTADFLQAVKANNRKDMYEALPDLEDLEKYSDRFKLKLLGTHEKFLVSDNRFAMLGSHNFLTSGVSKREREIGLRTNDSRIIEGLIERFDSAPILNVTLLH